MEKGLVSIVIPTHKGYDNIKRAVISALSQTYRTIEVIVVDDNGLGTEDQLKTEDELKCFVNDPRFKYVPHEHNINGSAARNTGIKNSNGEYVAFLDDDDEYTNDNIQNHVNRLYSMPSEFAMTYCGMELYAPNKVVQTIMPQVEGDVLFDFLCGRIRIGSSLLLVKRSAIDEINGFDESFRRHQDWEFIVRILNNHKIALVNKVGVKKYNLGRNNASNAKKFEEFRLHYLDKMESIIKSFPDKEQKQIYDSHYYLIGKEYLRAKDLKNCLRWTKKTSSPIYYMCKYVIDALKSKLKK